MTRGIFNWTSEEIVRFLKENNFQLSHSKGSHFYYIGKSNGELRQVAVPFHGAKAIKPRTLNGIIRQSGIDKKNWLNYQ